jgi:hypothetical protein
MSLAVALTTHLQLVPKVKEDELYPCKEPRHMMGCSANPFLLFRNICIFKENPRKLLQKGNHGFFAEYIAKLFSAVTTTASMLRPSRHM